MIQSLWHESSWETGSSGFAWSGPAPWLDTRHLSGKRKGKKSSCSLEPVFFLQGTLSTLGPRRETDLATPNAPIIGCSTNRARSTSYSCSCHCRRCIPLCSQCWAHERERERGFQTCPPPVPEGLGGLRELRHSSVLRALNVAKQLGSWGSFRRHLLLSTVFSSEIFNGGSGCSYRKGCLSQVLAALYCSLGHNHSSPLGQYQWSCTSLFNVVAEHS